jgi:hypothetical protein
MKNRGWMELEAAVWIVILIMNWMMVGNECDKIGVMLLFIEERNWFIENE